MSKARLVITAIEVEGRSPAEVIAAYGVSRSWLYELVKRYRAEGDAAFEPRSRRPHTSPRATPTVAIDLVLRLRKELTESGLDAGAETITQRVSACCKTVTSTAPSTRANVAACGLDRQMVTGASTWRAHCAIAA